jgi:tyrosinase
LASHVQDIANQYNANDQPAYQAAAQTFRIPFWDWASDYNLPQAATSPNTTVRAPNGTTISMPNPLFSYHFQQVPQQGPGFGGFLDQFPVTKRWPDASGVDNQSMADRKLSTASLKQDVVSIRRREIR